MRRRHVVLLATALALVVGAAGPAGAAPTPPPTAPGLFADVDTDGSFTPGTDVDLTRYFEQHDRFVSADLYPGRIVDVVVARPVKASASPQGPTILEITGTMRVTANLDFTTWVLVSPNNFSIAPGVTASHMSMWVADTATIGNRARLKDMEVGVENAMTIGDDVQMRGRIHLNSRGTLAIGKNLYIESKSTVVDIWSGLSNLDFNGLRLSAAQITMSAGYLVDDAATHIRAVKSKITQNGKRNLTSLRLHAVGPGATISFLNSEVSFRYLDSDPAPTFECNRALGPIKSCTTHA